MYMIIQNYKTNLKEKHNLWLITQHSVCSTHIFEWVLSISISKECLVNNIVYFKKARKNRAVLALILGIYLPLSTFESLQLTAFEIHNADLKNLIDVLPDF